MEEVKRPDRERIRALAARHMARLEQAAGEGRVEQGSLDNQDEVDALTAAMTADERAAFLRVYGEELSAATAQVERETAAVQLRSARAQAYQANTLQIVGYIAAGCAVLFLAIVIASR